MSKTDFILDFSVFRHFQSKISTLQEKKFEEIYLSEITKYRNLKRLFLKNKTEVINVHIYFKN